MEKYQCPCCGAPYNGRRCRECFYEPFTEEISHGLHTHEGEPLVISEPEKRPAQRPGASRRRNCGDYSGRRKNVLTKWILPVVIVLAAIVLRNALAGAVFDGIWDNSVDADAESDSYDAIVRPEDFHSRTVLYNDGGIQLIADWADGDSGANGIPVYVRNDSDRDVWITSTWDAVNGYMAQYNFLGCSVGAGKETMAAIWVDDTDLAEGNIETIAELSFVLEINDDKDYTAIDQSARITLHAGVDPDFVQPAEDGGTLIYRQDGIEVYYTGREGESCEDGAFLFRMENHSGRDVGIFTQESYVNGEQSDLFLYGELASDTWSNRKIWLYSLTDAGITEIREITSLEIVLGIWDRDGDDLLPESGRISVPIMK